MKLAICSDLHLEFENSLPNNMFVDADVLVLAGDICEARHAESRHMKIFEQLANHYPHVIYVAGNHEHYRSEFNKTKTLLNNLSEKIPNLYFLERDTVEIDGKVFAGCTLWSYISPAEDWLATQSMNDYKLITYNNNGSYRKFKVTDSVLDHSRSVKWLKSLDTPDVVITHHAPSSLSVHPAYANDLLNCCYFSNLNDVMQKTKLWIHGHIHYRRDYIQGTCRVVCNPRGYTSHEYQLVSSFTMKVVII